MNVRIKVFIFMSVFVTILVSKMKNNFKKITSLMLAFIMLFMLFVPANAVQTTNVNSINIYEYHR